MTGEAKRCTGVMEYWSNGFRINAGLGTKFEFRIPFTQHSITPILHYSNYPLTYSANAARQSRIGRQPTQDNRSERALNSFANCVFAARATAI